MKIHSAYSVVAAYSASVPEPEYAERPFVVHHGESQARICLSIKVRVATCSRSVPELEYAERPFPYTI